MAAAVKMLGSPFSLGVRTREDHTYTLFEQLRTSPQFST
jgi:hypothetical protein